VLESLRSLRLELDALLTALRGLSGTLVTSFSILQRIEQFFLSWSNLKSRLVAGNVPPEVIERTDAFVTELVRLTRVRSRKSTYLRLLNEIREAFGQLLLEIARIGSVPGALQPRAERSSLVPEISGLTNELIPNALFGWSKKMRAFLREFNYDNNVFIMVAYRKRLAPLIESVEAKLQELGLNGIVAKDHRITDDLYNPLACLLCCRYGVAIFDRGETGQLHNANIVYELAMMQTLKRPCVILKHHSVRTMPSDFLHKLYETYRTSADAVSRLDQWWKTAAWDDQ